MPKLRHRLALVTVLRRGVCVCVCVCMCVYYYTCALSEAATQSVTCSCVLEKGEREKMQQQIQQLQEQIHELGVAHHAEETRIQTDCERKQQELASTCSQLMIATSQRDEAQSQILLAANKMDDMRTQICDLQEEREKTEHRLQQVLAESRQLTIDAQQSVDNAAMLCGEKQVLSERLTSLQQAMSVMEKEKLELQLMLEAERDNHMKQSMELERELKEIQHVQEQSIVGPHHTLLPTTDSEQRLQIRLYE